ncbi:MAG: transposase [Clostridia bacterium]|nr:transposase [Clostridia bacterium]
MPRQARKKSESGIYHIMLRGINKQKIFRDKQDYWRFLETLGKYKAESGYTIYAYCLMKNHAHILLKTGKEDLSMILKRISGSYVYWYNLKYGRVGHLFQDRFRSEPVDDDTYFLTVLRYIHQNPVKAGFAEAPEGYAYSSYWDYINKNDDLVDISFAASILGDMDFAEFHNEANNDECLDCEKKSRITDKEGMSVLKRILKTRNVNDIVNFEENEKQELIRKMKSAGMSIRQISRLTGLGVGIVRKY